MFNAAVTAEGAICVLMENCDSTLWRSRILVCGWGRIARLLTLRLLALGAEVCVAARRADARAEASALGAESCEFAALAERIGSFDGIVNTVPARVLDDAVLCSAAEGALLLELASAPGGFEKTLAENIGLRVLSAPGLPGRYAPRRAAEILCEAIYASIEEGEG